MQPQMLFFYVQAFYKNPAVMYGWQIIYFVFGAVTQR